MPKAYLVTLDGIESIVPALSVSDAKRITFNAALDANYRVKWIDMRVKRKPEFDAWAKTAKKQCWIPEFASMDALRVEGD